MFDTDFPRLPRMRGMTATVGGVRPRTVTRRTSMATAKAGRVDERTDPMRHRVSQSASAERAGLAGHDPSPPRGTIRRDWRGLPVAGLAASHSDGGDPFADVQVRGEVIDAILADIKRAKRNLTRARREQNEAAKQRWARRLAFATRRLESVIS